MIPKCELVYLTTELPLSSHERLLDHGEKLHDVPDEYLTEALPIAKKIAAALGAENYNILQASV